MRLEGKTDLRKSKVYTWSTSSSFKGVAGGCSLCLLNLDLFPPAPQTQTNFKGYYVAKKSVGITAPSFPWYKKKKQKKLNSSFKKLGEKRGVAGKRSDLMGQEMIGR